MAYTRFMIVLLIAETLMPQSSSSASLRPNASRLVRSWLCCRWCGSKIGSQDSQLLSLCSIRPLSSSMMSSARGCISLDSSRCCCIDTSWVQLKLWYASWSSCSLVREIWLPDKRPRAPSPVSSPGPRSRSRQKSVSLYMFNGIILIYKDRLRSNDSISLGYLLSIRN